MTLDLSHIQRITKEGLFYLDEAGEEQFIDFQVCYEGQLARFMEPENLKRFQEGNHMTEEHLQAYVQQRKECKYIAEKRLGEPYGDGPSCLVFYTDPPTQFVFGESRGPYEWGIWLQIEFLGPMPPDAATKEEW